MNREAIIVGATATTAGGLTAVSLFESLRASYFGNLANIDEQRAIEHQRVLAYFKDHPEKFAPGVSADSLTNKLNAANDSAVAYSNLSENANAWADYTMESIPYVLVAGIFVILVSLGMRLRQKA